MKEIQVRETARWFKGFRDQATTVNVITSPTGHEWVEIRDVNVNCGSEGFGVLLNRDAVGAELLASAETGTDRPHEPEAEIEGKVLVTIPRSAEAEVRIRIIRIDHHPALEMAVHNPLSGERGRAVWTCVTDRTLGMVRAAQRSLGVRTDDGWPIAIPTADAIGADLHDSKRRAS
jgi:hypothetical protein